MAVDTTDALLTLHAQMEDMLFKNSTYVAFCLASPGNRRGTARGGYDHAAFDKMVRSPTYAPLVSGTKYEVLSQRQHGNQFAAIVKVVGPTWSKVFDFGMTLQPSSVIDEHPSLEPYQLRRGHPPQWRTDSVMPSRYAR